jgi:hypothetical protein
VTKSGRSRGGGKGGKERKYLRGKIGEKKNKKRLILCYHLSRSVWQFYSSDWAASGWHKDFVHFVFQDDSSSIFVNE